MKATKLSSVLILLALLLGTLSAAITSAQEPTESWEIPSSFPLPRHEQTASAPAVPDPAVQLAHGEVNMPSPIMNFEGMNNVGFPYPLPGVLPPDTDGQVGPDHYVQIVNHGSTGSWVAVWDKSGVLLTNFGLSSLWTSGDPCHDDALGDPVVLYDQENDRWLLTQFILDLATYAPPYYECVAVSQTSDPTGSWYPYTFRVHNSKFNDYPKFGVWPDGYYMSANQFAYPYFDWAGSGAWVFKRDDMVAGIPPQSPSVINCTTDTTYCQYFDVWDINEDYGGLLPSNWMGDTAPPEGAPNYYMSVDMDWDGPNDILHIFEFHTDWGTPANSTFSWVADLVVAPFDWEICPAFYECIDQPDGAPRLDTLADRLMMHLWYRSFGDHESLVVNHTVDAGGGRAGIRWYEIRGGAVNTTLADAAIYQQGTYAPDDGLHRWMGSIAMDSAGNISLGYSVSSADVYPSIQYAGRLASDPLGTLPQAEGLIVTGSGVQTHSAARWGDYSAMSVDPVNDCTFWYTQEYIETTGNAPWQTRIASYEFPGCLEPTDTMHVTNIRMRARSLGDRFIVMGLVPIRDQSHNPVEGATVSAQWTLPNGAQPPLRQSDTNANGVARFQIRSAQTGVHEICVTDVVKDGYIYDPSQNMETCETVTVP